MTSPNGHRPIMQNPETVALRWYMIPSIYTADMKSIDEPHSMTPQMELGHIKALEWWIEQEDDEISTKQ